MRSQRAAKVVDAMTGVGLLSQGLSEMSHADGSRALATVAIGGGAIILGAMILRRRLAFAYFPAVVSFVQGLACAFVGIASMQRGTHYIQFAWSIAAIAFIGAAIVQVRRTHRASMPAAVAVEEQST